MSAPTRGDRVRAAGLVLAVLGAGGCVDVRAPSAPSPDASPIVRSDTSLQDDEEGSFEGAEPARYEASRPPPASPAADDSTGATYRAVVPPLPADAPAIRIGALSDADCEKESARAGLPLEKVATGADGVASPMRLTGPLGGVRFVVPPASSPHGVLDCRLGLALADLASVLARFDVVEVKVDNFYRKNAVLPPGSKKGKKAKRSAKPSQHARALAIDVTSFKLKDGRELTIPRDWHAPIGSVSCGPEATLEGSSVDAIHLRDLVCEIARRGIFHRVLTPSFNAAHRGHFHFDLGRGDSHATVR
ncbi:MAG: extensin family protein [Polyangiaceae bacterium]|jgi:hypothetical protein|nr:extensin family protein [Polyangiaceae bacterium]MBK8937033.1 extensin family protein [Polyangiaceae bacterium]